MNILSLSRTDIISVILNETDKEIKVLDLLKAL